eukprot:scaffold1.g5273.t1
MTLSLATGPPRLCSGARQRRPARQGAARAVAAPLKEAERAAVVAPEAGLDGLRHLQHQHQHQQRAAESAAASSSGRVVVEAPEELRSTLEHQLWVGSTSVVLAATMWQGLGRVEDVGGALEAGAGLLAAYVVADFASGVYHWIVDNYGDADTPVLGSQIAAFQGHHQRPWTITEREFCNNVHLTCKPAFPVAAAALAASLGADTPLCHAKKSELPGAVVALQDTGLLISRRDHGAHHRPPFDANYAIVSGWTNPLLDGVGFYVALERLVCAAGGPEPRSWHDTTDWLEQQRP